MTLFHSSSFIQVIHDMLKQLHSVVQDKMGSYLKIHITYAFVLLGAGT